MAKIPVDEVALAVERLWQKLQARTVPADVTPELVKSMTPDQLVALDKALESGGGFREVRGPGLGNAGPVWDANKEGLWNDMYSQHPIDVDGITAMLATRRDAYRHSGGGKESFDWRDPNRSPAITGGPDVDAVYSAAGYTEAGQRANDAAADNWEFNTNFRPSENSDLGKHVDYVRERGGDTGRSLAWPDAWKRWENIPGIAAGAVGAGVLLGAGKAAAADKQEKLPLDGGMSMESPEQLAVKGEKYSGKLYERFHNLPRDQRELIVAALPPEKQVPFLQGYKKYKAAVPSAVQSYLPEAPTAPETPLGPQHGMTPVGDSFNIVQTPGGARVVLAGRGFTVDKIPAWQMLLGFPAMINTLSQVKREAVDPLVIAGQDALREGLGVQADSELARIERRMPSQRLMSMGVPAEESRQLRNTAELFTRAGFQWLLGQRVFTDLPEESRFQMVSDMDALMRHPLFQSALPVQQLRQLGIAPEEMAGAGLALAQEGGKLPLYLLGPTQAMQAVQSSSKAIAPGMKLAAHLSAQAARKSLSNDNILQAAGQLGTGLLQKGMEKVGPALGPALVGGTQATIESVLDPTQKVEHAAYGGAAVGAAIGKAAPWVGEKVVIGSMYADKFIKTLISDIEGLSQPFGDDFAAAMTSATKSLATEMTPNKATVFMFDKPSPKVPGDPKAGLTETLTKREFIPKTWNKDFDPSLIVFNNNEAIAVRLHQDGVPSVARLPLDSDDAVAKVKELADRSGAHFEYTGDLLKASEYAIKLGADRRPTDPLVAFIPLNKTEKLDIYRLGSAKAREQAYLDRNLVEFTKDGEKAYGFLLDRVEHPKDPTKELLVFSPGDDKHRIEGFIDQVVTVEVPSSRHTKALKEQAAATGTRPEGAAPQRRKTDGAPADVVRRLSREEIRKLAAIVPAPQQKHADKMWAVLTYDDLQQRFNKLMKGLPDDKADLIASATSIKKGLLPSEVKKAQAEAAEKVSNTLGISRTMARHLMVTYGEFQRAAKSKDTSRVKEAVARGRKLFEDMTAEERLAMSFENIPEDWSDMRGLGYEKRGPFAIRPTDRSIREQDDLFTMGRPFTPDEAYARAITGQSGKALATNWNKVVLNDKRVVEVVHVERAPGTENARMEPQVSETFGTVMVRDAEGRVFTVDAKEIAGPVPEPVRFPFGGRPAAPAPAVTPDAAVPGAPAKTPLALEAGVTPGSYYSSPTKLRDELAWVLRNQRDEVGERNVQAIMQAARNDGMQPGVMAREYRLAMEMATDVQRPLPKPDWLDAGGGKPPAVPPEPPPPGSGGPPTPPPGRIPDDEALLIPALVRDKTLAERAKALLWGNRAIAEKDMGQLINLAWGTKNMHAVEEKLFASMRRTFGEKVMSDFDKSLLDAAEGRISVNDLQRSFPKLFEKPTVRKEVERVIAERDALEQELRDLGVLTEKSDMSDDDLVSYVTHQYMRFLLPPSEWAKLVKSQKPELVAEATDYFTALYMKDGSTTSLDEARSKALSTVNRVIGAEDSDAAKAIRANRTTGESGSSLKERKLDKLEREVLEGKAKNIDAHGVKLLRQLLGQNESGMLAMATTIARQKQLIAQHRLWNEVALRYSNGPDFMVTKLLTDELLEAGWKQVPLDRAAYGPLAGKYMHPDMYESLITQPSRVVNSNKLLASISSWVKGNETSLGGPTTWNSNFFGNMYYSVLAGADPLSGRLPKLGEALRLIYRAWKNPLSDEGRAIEEMVRLGVDAPSYGAAEFAPVQKELAARWLGNLGKRDNFSLLSAPRLTWDAMSWVRKKAAAAYDLNDRMWKAGCYLSLLEKGGIRADGTVDKRAAARFLVGNPALERAKSQLSPGAKARFDLPEMAESELVELIKREAALRVTSSFPMPDQVSAGVAAARQNLGWVARYLTFVTEDTRVQAAIPTRIARGERDLAFRLLGYAMVAGGTSMYLLPELRRNNGITDEQVEAAWNNLPKTQRGFRPLSFALPWRDKNGNAQFLDLSRYFGPASYLRGLDTNASIGSNIGQVAKNVLLTPLEGSTPGGWVTEALARAGIGEQQYIEKLRAGQKGIPAAAGYLWKESLLPKVGTWGSGLAADMQGSLTKSPLDPTQVAARATGFTVTPSGTPERIGAALSGAASVRAAMSDTKKAVRDEAFGKQSRGPVQRAKDSLFGRETLQEKVQKDADEVRRRAEELRRNSEYNWKAGKQ